MLSPWPAITVERGGGPPTSLKPDSRGIVQLDTGAGDRLVFKAP
jgi:hypothetical protein